ncbi:hypothetical protein D3C87_1535820 [compost metagenome]
MSSVAAPFTRLFTKENVNVSVCTFCCSSKYVNDVLLLTTEFCRMMPLPADDVRYQISKAPEGMSANSPSPKMIRTSSLSSVSISNLLRFRLVLKITFSTFAMST